MCDELAIYVNGGGKGCDQAGTRQGLRSSRDIQVAANQQSSPPWQHPRSLDCHCIQFVMRTAANILSPGQATAAPYGIRMADVLLAERNELYGKPVALAQQRACPIGHEPPWKHQHEWRFQQQPHAMKPERGDAGEEDRKPQPGDPDADRDDPRRRRRMVRKNHPAQGADAKAKRSNHARDHEKGH